MVETTLRTLAIVASLFVIVSFGFFARDEFAGASDTQQQLLNGHVDRSLPTGTHHKQPRRFIDSVARTLLRPFAAASPNGSKWAERGVPTVLALLIYGFGLGFLARAARGLP